MFYLLAAGYIPPVYLSVASGLFCFGFNNILSFTHKKKKNPKSKLIIFIFNYGSILDLSSSLIQVSRVLMDREKLEVMFRFLLAFTIFINFIFKKTHMLILFDMVCFNLDEKNDNLFFNNKFGSYFSIFHGEP